MTGDSAGATVAPVVSADQRLFFDAYGHVVLRGLFADEIDELSDAFDEVFDDPANPRMDMNIIGHRWRSRFAMGAFVEIHPRLTELMTDPRLVGAARGLLGEGAAYSCSDGAVYHCETEWHYDTPTHDLDRRHVKFAFYLEPLEADRGAPRVMPGSHLLNRTYRGGPLEPYLGFDGATEERTGILGEHLPHWPLPTQPGDVVAWDFRILHSSYGRTDPRRKFALNYFSGPEAEPAEHAWARMEAAQAEAEARLAEEASGARPAEAAATPSPAAAGGAIAQAPRPAPVPWSRRARRVAGRAARRVRRTT